MGRKVGRKDKKRSEKGSRKGSAEGGKEKAELKYRKGMWEVNGRNTENKMVRFC